MALQVRPSRFAVLPDDVPDSVASKTKKGGGGGGDGEKSNKNKNKQAKNTNNGKKAANNQNNKPKQTLKGLAFGGSGDVKPKPLVVVPMPKEPTPGPSGSSTSSNSARNGNVPNGKTSAQWEEWQRRDSELVVGDYESQLESALIQSKLEFEKELLIRGQQNQGKNKSKKKPVTVSLNEFNAKLAQQPKSAMSSLPVNFHAKAANGNSAGELGSVDNIDQLDQEFLQKLRMEAKLEIDREKQLTVERELIKNRQAAPNKKNSKKSAPEPVVIPVVDPKDEELGHLRLENEQLKEEVESYRTRLKKVYDIFQEAQELKDKAKLLCEVENLRKMNEDQTAEIQSLHSQLEQERSKSHAAVNEYRKLMEHTRRRTNTEASQ